MVSDLRVALMVYVLTHTGNGCDVINTFSSPPLIIADGPLCFEEAGAGRDSDEFMSRAWVKCAADWFFGGAWDYEMKDVVDLQEMKEKKLIKVVEYTDWKSRQLHQTKKIALTNKGIKAFYDFWILTK
ncbi:MAG: hypothetical protein IJ899_05565 [Blautia sp.]|nr:hypothetical protein [Blautia sp.]